MSRIGQKIKEARTQKGMSQKELGKKCGVSESYVIEVESGRKVINEAMIKKISSILGTNLEEPMLAEMDIEEEHEKKNERKPLIVKKTVTDTPVMPEWQSAFSNIIKDIPIYNVDFSRVMGKRSLPVIDKKVEGYNPDKLIYIVVPDDMLSGFRIKKNDLIMTVLNNEFLGNGFYLIQYNEKRVIRQVKKLDGNKVLILSHYNEIKTDTVDLRDVKIIGHCVKVEINLIEKDKGRI